MPLATPFLDADELLASTFVRHVEIHETLGSTNDRAAELARDTTIELPALVAARHQTAGRGRGRHAWWSADGALTFTLLLEPSALGISVENWPQLSLTTAVAICDAIQLRMADCGWRIENKNPKSEIRNPKSPRVGIKWPNDVLINDRKIAGILIESPGGAAPAKDRLIVGVGINVNNSWDDAPPDVVANGVALRDVVGQPLNRQMILVEFLRAIEQRIKQLSANDAVLRNAWQDGCSLTGREIVVEADGSAVEGRCRGMAEDGALLVQTKFAIERFYSGSVRVIR